MRSIPVLAVLLALGACSGNAPQESPAEAACRREARSAPGVRDAMERLSGNNVMQQERVRAEAVAAERAAYLRCMRAHGLAAPGGVEPVLPPR
jgi:hypothetical protein